MVFSFSWDSNFESRPGSGLNRNSLDNELRLLPIGIRERMEIEHNWGPYNLDDDDRMIDDGTHIPGKTTILAIGDYDDITDYTNPQEGALYVARDEEESGNMQIYIYYSSAWHKISEFDHGALSDLTGVGVHPQYLLLTGGTIDGVLNMGGSALYLDTSSSIGSGMVVGKHRESDHTFDDLDAIDDDTITLAKLDISQNSYSGSIAALSAVALTLNPCFAPNLYSSTNWERICIGAVNTGSIPPYVALRNRGIASHSYRANLTEIV